MTGMTDILDLDALSPQKKQVKISGKIIDVYPPKVMQLIEIQRLFEIFKENKNDATTYIEALRKALSPIVPAIQDDPTIDFSLEQLIALLAFVQSAAVPKSLENKAPEAPKKNP